MRALIFSSFPVASCTSDATVPSAASAWFFVMVWPYAAAVAASAAAGAACASTSTASGFCSVAFAFASVASCRRLFAHAWFRLFDFLIKVSVLLLVSIFARFVVSFTLWRLGVMRFAFLLRNLELVHNTSVVPTHVYCFVGFRISAPRIMLSVCQNVVQLLLNFLECGTSLASAVLQQNYRQEAIESSIHLCSLLCWACSDRQTTILYLLLGQAQRWNHLQWSSCNFLFQSSKGLFCKFSRCCGRDSHCVACTRSPGWSVVCWPRSTMRPRVRKRIVSIWSGFFHLSLTSFATPCLLMNFPDSTMMWPCCVSQISLPCRDQYHIPCHLM